jgi:hypothetical protein
VIVLSRKRLIIFAVFAVLVISGAAWWFDFGQNLGNPAGADPTARPQVESVSEAEKKAVTDAATQLATKLTSANPAAYKEAWARSDNLPPMAPPGTKINIIPDSVQSYEEFRRVEGEMIKPSESPVRIIIYLAPGDASGKWRVNHVEVK